MGIFLCGAAMGGPARVADTINPVERSLADGFFQIAQLAGGAADFELAMLVNDGDSRGIVAAVFETLQTVKNQRDNRLRANVANNSTHIALAPESAKSGKRAKSTANSG
jgi:hypothetical protein